MIVNHFTPPIQDRQLSGAEEKMATNACIQSTTSGSGRIRKSSFKRLSFDERDNGTRAREAAAPKSVHFTTIEIRDYSQCLGDHPCVNRGAPLSLDWDYQSEQSYDIEEYEQRFNHAQQQEQKKRSQQRMIRLAFERQYLLQNLGYSEEEINNRSKDAKNDRKKRSQTRRTMIFEPFIVIAEDTKRWIAKRKMKNQGDGRNNKSTLTRPVSHDSLTCLSSESLSESSDKFAPHYATKGTVLRGH